MQNTNLVLRGKSLLRARGFTSSLALIAAQFAKLITGGLFWIVAARSFSPDEVGLAAGIVSLISISTVVGLLGAGASVIRLFPGWRQYPHSLLKSAVKLALIGSAVASGSAVILTRFAFDDLDALASKPAFMATFVVACVLGGVLLLGDQVSIAMWRGKDVFSRACVTGIVMIGSLGVLSVVSGSRTALAILACWTLGRVIALVLNIDQVRRSLHRAIHTGEQRAIGMIELLRVGVRNHALTIFDMAPGFAITIIVTETLSTEAGAYWYAVWMTATSVYLIPGMFGMTLFAAVAEPGRRVGRMVHESLVGSLGLGVVGALGIFALARPALELFGGQYAEAGVAPLRVLVIAVIPLALVNAYFGLCRATDRLGEATVVAVLGGSAGLAAATVAGIEAGLLEIAIAWLGAQAMVGAWAAWRLRTLTRERTAG